VNELAAWLLSIGAFAGVVVCTVIAARSLAGDGARGRRRCPKCWHELGPATHAGRTLQCTECGHHAASEGEVTRARRQPIRATLAISGAVLIIAAMRVRLVDRGVWSMAPTSVLLAVTPRFSDGGYRSSGWELAWRVRAGTASDAQVRDALDIFVAGDDDALPPSDAWRAKYRDLGSAVIARLGGGGAGPADPALRKLFAIPPAIKLAVAAGSTPALLALDADVWWPPSTDAQLTLTFADGSTRAAEFHPEGRFPSLIVELPKDAKAGDPVTCAFTYASPGGDPVPLAPQSLTIPTLDVVPPPKWEALDDDAMRHDVSLVFAEGLSVWAQGTPRGGMRFNATVTTGEIFNGVAVGLRVELLEEGIVRRTSRMWWPGGSARGIPMWLTSIEDASAMQRLYDEKPEGAWRWKLRVTGDERLARYILKPPGLRGAPDADPPLRGWFAGTVEVPLAVERMAGPSPTRRWKVAPQAQ